MQRTDERIEFLTDCLIGAIENYGYGWFIVEEYKPDPPNAYAVITDEETEETHRVDIETIARGLGVIKNAVAKEFPCYGGTETVLANAETGERLHLSSADRRQIMESNRENDGTEIDVVYALAILECGLFGQVTYA